MPAEVAPHLVVLLQQGVHVLEEGDGGGAVDDIVDLRLQPLPVGLGQAQPRNVHVAGDDHHLVAHVQGHLAVLPVQVEQLLAQQLAQALLACMVNGEQTVYALLWETAILSLARLLRTSHLTGPASP
jgi:hypothetical protein